MMTIVQNTIKVKNKNNMEDMNETAQEQTVSTTAIENMSNEALLNVVLEKLDYDMVKDVLIKPLEVIKVKKAINVPVETDEVDEETGEKVMAMEVKEMDIDSVFRTGVVLALPANGADWLNIGDTVVFPHKYSIDFDLFKDSVLVKPYDVIAIVKK